MSKESEHGKSTPKSIISAYDLLNGFLQRSRFFIVIHCLLMITNTSDTCWKIDRFSMSTLPIQSIVKIQPISYQTRFDPLTKPHVPPSSCHFKFNISSFLFGSTVNGNQDPQLFHSVHFSF